MLHERLSHGPKISLQGKKWICNQCLGAKSKLAKQIDLKILDKTCPFKLLQSYGVKLDPLNLAHSFRLPLGKIQIEFFSIGGFSSQIRLLKNSNMQDRLFVRQFFFFEKMVKYHPWHYGKESSDKTFFHTGENYHYSFNFNFLSTLDFLIIM